MISPRESFKASPYAKGWQDRVDSEQFQAAANAAMLEMALLNRNTQELYSSAGAQKKMEGAMAFLDIFMSLTSPAPESKSVHSRQNLDHRV
jgi:DNA-binding PucR family transcriptional regulator